MSKDLQEITEPVSLRSLKGFFFDGVNFISPLEATCFIQDGKIGEFRQQIGRADLEIPQKTLIIPGGINLHGHGREVYGILPGQKGDQTYKEDSWTWALALAHGGATHGMGMPNLSNDICTQQEYDRQVTLINSAQPHRKKPIMPLSMYALIKPGSSPQIKHVMYKLLWNTFGPTNFERDEDVPETLKNYRGKWVTAHCETIAGMINNPSLQHHERRPRLAAMDAVRIFLRCAKDNEFHGHIAHISSAEEVDIVNEFRRMGASVSCEVTPQSLTLDYETFEQMTGRPIKWSQQNPPLRSAAERDKLVRKIGDIEILATDHAPHTRDEKEEGISGMPQDDTAGQVYLEFVTNRVISLVEYIQKRSIIPGRILEKQLGLRMGKFNRNYDANFALISLGKPSQVRDEDVMSKCGWTPYHNMRFNNTIEGVVINGTLYTAAALKKLR